VRILIWSDRPSLVGELGGFASLLDGSPELATLAFGPDHARSDVDIVYSADEPGPDASRAVDVLVAAVERFRPELVVVGATKLGLETAPRLCERLGLAYAPWATAIAGDASVGFEAKTTAYAGAGIRTVRSAPGALVATVAPGVGSPIAHTRAGAVELIEAPTRPSPITLVGQQAKVKGARLEDARVVIDVGRGVREREDLALVEALAKPLSAAVACSRPVAADRDWFPEWLGLSGAKIHPELCVTIGLSGAIQHVVGIRDARCIVAINNDEAAPIFAQSDVGVVADLYDFVPVLVQRLLERGAEPTGRS
jgi:electron transfer flavoprotein alpha subunit